jgi:DNA-binding GntR family transcriptional regulator
MTRQSAQEIAYDHLHQEILSGRLPGGARILPEEVAEQLGLSRMPVREAIRQLDAEGFVTIRPNRGAVVTERGPAEVMEIFEMRGVLEGLAARHAARAAGLADIEDLDALATAMSRAVSSPGRWLEKHELFHERLTTLAGRPRLAAEARRLRLALRPMLRLYAEEHREPVTTGHEHELIVDAIRDRDARRAERLTVAHVMANAEQVVAMLSRRPAAAEAADATPAEAAAAPAAARRAPARVR